MKRFSVGLGCAALLTICALGEENKNPVTFGGFVDGYYAFDLNQPPSLDRAYTTLPTRHNEFAINMAYVEAKVRGDRVRGRLALQTGTSVYANYASEFRDPTKNGVQLADVLQHFQEATAGYRLAEGIWVDAGIFLSHIGSESFVSRDNWTYTRSLIADFSPYYQAGVRLVYDPSTRWSFQLHVLNGWQNIVETNSDKSLGTQVTFRPSERFSITHNSLVGRETALRIFQDLVLMYRVSDAWESALTIDFGMQRRAGVDGFSTWYGTSFQNRFRLDPSTFLSVRLESYADPDGVIAPTKTPNNFQAIGASVNLDRKLTPDLLFRNEVRWLRSRDPIFSAANGAKTDTVFAVTSLGLSF